MCTWCCVVYACVPVCGQLIERARRCLHRFHPNINSEGGICADDFKKLWKPQSNVLTVIEMLRAILANPNPDDPLELKPGELMKRDLEAFETKVREMISEDNEDSDGDDSGSGWDDDDDDE